MILKLNKEKYSLVLDYLKNNLDKNNIKSFILLESAKIGMIEPIYHVYLDDSNKKQFEKIINFKTDQIKDKGRTSGFYQHFASKGGIFNKKNFVKFLTENEKGVIIKNKGDKNTSDKTNKLFSNIPIKEAELLIEGDTWIEIIKKFKGNK